MASCDTSQNKCSSRVLHKRKQEPGIIALPERFRSDDEDEGEDEHIQGLAEASDKNLAFMHRSVFGVIAAARSKEDFQTLMTAEQSEDESDDATQLPNDLLKGASTTNLTKSDYKKKFSDNKLLRSLPLLRSRNTKEKGDVSARASPTPPLPASPVSDEKQFKGDAPIMSQMLQARANAESLESSNATLTANLKKSASSTSLKSIRKAPIALPEALKDVFQFEEPEEVISEYQCCYLANVLLQGYMYVTQRHVCFYAYLQQKNNTILKSGHLAKRGKTNPHYRRFWFTLKGTVLSYFTDPSTPYFPSGNIDLRYGISAEIHQDKAEKEKSKQSPYFSVKTDKRIYYFKADSVTSAKEWVRQLQKVIFRSHNDGDSVKISLPIDNILDIEENPVLDVAETIKIRVIDNDETFAVDEYFFSFFSHGKDALNVLRIMTQDTTAAKALAQQISPSSSQNRLQNAPNASWSQDLQAHPSITLTSAEVYENVRATVQPSNSNTCSPRISLDASRSSFDYKRPSFDNKRPSFDNKRPSFDNKRPSLDIMRSSFDKSRHSFDRGRRSASAASRVSFNHASPRSTSLSSAGDAVDSRPSNIAETIEHDSSASGILSGTSIFQTPTLSNIMAKKVTNVKSMTPAQRSANHSTATSRSASQEREGDRPVLKSYNSNNDSTRPSDVNNAQVNTVPRTISSGAYQRANDFTGMLKHQGRRMSNLFNSTPRGYYEKVYGMWTGGKKHYADANGLHTEDYVYDPDDESDTAQAEARFRDYFALPESERLVASYFAHLLRVLPLYGKIYIGSTRLCYRSLLPGTRTKLVIPLKDIINVDKEKGFRFGYSGMVVVIRGHEEIFFEFNTANLRDDCTITVLKPLEALRSISDSALIDESADSEALFAAKENEILQEARRREHGNEQDADFFRDLAVTDRDVPPILFDDTGVSIVDFKPSEPLNITCLTIGSRGDVQPYIALCKGFLKEGHKPKIATHAEFEPWIRKHGIDFAPVEGDPAELMRICVENGMFTPSFLYEANSKFRGFLDTLLVTAWTACQGADVLIESPSAMAGIHIAEALEIPYFRAFTMPWTRTRAYPHAFAVPNHKMGGAYNYMTYVLFDNIFWQATASQVNRWRRKVLNLGPTTLDRLQPNKVPFLYNFSPSVVVPPLDFPDWIRVTGYWFLDEASTWTPPPALTSFIARARADKMPLVYIGFGSVVVSDSKALTASVVAAVQKADVRCVLSKGWSDRLDSSAQKTQPEVSLPDSIFLITSAPHDWLFSQMDAAVHHGGAGTTGASLRAGIPTIIKPFFGDQFFFGARLQDLGVGVCIRKVSEQVLGKALWIATNDARMKDKARLLGEQIRNEDGVSNAIKAVYRDLEYARTLVVARAGKNFPKGQKRKSVVDDSIKGKGKSNDFDDVDDDNDDDEDHDDHGAHDTGESWTFVDESLNNNAKSGRSSGFVSSASQSGSNTPATNQQVYKTTTGDVVPGLGLVSHGSVVEGSENKSRWNLGRIGRSLSRSNNKESDTFNSPDVH